MSLNGLTVTTFVVMGWCVKSLSPLSPAEQLLMDLVWQHQPASVAVLLELVNAGREEPISRNTLQTQLNRLEAKAWLKWQPDERPRLYRAAVAERWGRGKILSELKQRLFGGSGLSLVRCLVEEGGLDEDDMRELKELIANHKKGGKP
jgi:BlaI family transcriptional regulator, penicillinase repressor